MTPVLPCCITYRCNVTGRCCLVAEIFRLNLLIPLQSVSFSPLLYSFSRKERVAGKFFSVRCKKSFITSIVYVHENFSFVDWAVIRPLIRIQVLSPSDLWTQKCMGSAKTKNNLRAQYYKNRKERDVEGEHRPT